MPHRAIRLVPALSGARNVIVAINQGTSAKTQTFSVKGDFANPRRYTTSASKRIADDGVVAVSGGSFAVTLDAQSIVTIVADPTTDVAGGVPSPPRIQREGWRVKAGADVGGFALRDLRGRTLRTSAAIQDGSEIDLRGLAPGLYLAIGARDAAPVPIAGP